MLIRLFAKGRNRFSHDPTQTDNELLTTNLNRINSYHYTLVLSPDQITGAWQLFDFCVKKCNILN